MNFVAGVTRCSESAPAIVTTLNTEPGSKASLTARLRCRVGLTEGDLLASYDGASAIASTAPVFGSSTIAVALFARHCETVWRSTCSAFAWIVWSSVRKTALPGRAGVTRSILIGRPNGSRTTICSPSRPLRLESSENSRPVSPLLSTPA